MKRSVAKLEQQALLGRRSLVSARSPMAWLWCLDWARRERIDCEAARVLSSHLTPSHVTPVFTCKTGPRALFFAASAKGTIAPGMVGDRRAA